MSASRNLYKRTGWRREERRPGAAPRERRATVGPTFLSALAMALMLVAAGNGIPAKAQTAQQPAAATKTHPDRAGTPLDRTGRKRVGKASFYAGSFAGRTMADGTPMKPQGDNAASKTLPLGTRARVTNLETGRTATVTIRDRGPYVAGRIVDLSPSTAQKIGIDRKEGVAMVEVTPIEVPSPK